MFVDDIVDESRTQVEKKRERWRYVLEKKGKNRIYLERWRYRDKKKRR